MQSSRPRNITRDLNKNTKTDVDNVNKGVNESNRNNTRDKNRDRAKANQNSGEPQAGPATKPQEKKQNGKEARRPQRSPLMEKLIKDAALKMWLLAYQHLYPEWEFSQDQFTFFRSFLTPYFAKVQNPESLQACMQQYEWRIERAKEYIEKNPGFQLLEPLKYFNPKYKNGFIATKPWWKKYRILYVKKSRLNEAKKMAANCHHNQSLQYYQACEKTINGWGDQQVVDLFNKLVANLKVK
jgi:hypothetical protein